jgi:hypothetical protein
MTNNNFALRRERLRIVIMLRKGEDFALENVW